MSPVTSGFATADEAAYPRLLCQRLADVVERALRRLQRWNDASHTAGPLVHVRAAAQRQAGGKRSPQPVPEDALRRLTLPLTQQRELDLCREWKRRRKDGVGRLCSRVRTPSMLRCPRTCVES